MAFLLLVLALLPGLTIPLRADWLGAPVVSSGPSAGVVEPFVWPIAKRIAGQKTAIVSKFGHRQVPDTHLDEMHEGVDFGAPEGAAVRAARSGKVIFAGFSTAYVSRKDKKEKNRLVIIRHADGMSSRYVHIDRLKIQPGQDVTSGQILGIVGDSDEWTTRVIHFEIRDPNGKALDPMRFFQETPKGHKS